MNQSAGGVLRRSLNDFLHMELDEAALNRLQWRDFGNGLSMARLAREDARELGLYRTAADASPDAFVKHEHIGGGVYFGSKGQNPAQKRAYAKGDTAVLYTPSGRTPPAFW